MTESSCPRPFKDVALMLIDYSTTIALRCPCCREFGYYTLSIFTFVDAKTVNIACNCGYVLAAVGSKDGCEYWLRLNCLLCSSHHIFHYPRREFWSDDIIKIDCPGSGITRGYLGPETLLQQGVLGDKECPSLFGSMDFDHYFHEPEIMLAVLDIIHDIAAAGRLFCQCGEDKIDITMYPDQLELICRRCNGLVMINAASQDSLLSLQRLKCLLLPERLEGGYDPDGSFYG